MSHCLAKAECYNDWDALTPIGHEKNRFCGDCNCVVRLCASDTEKALNKAIGRVVAIKPESKFKNFFKRQAGEVMPKANDIEANVYLMPEQTLSMRQREEINLLFPSAKEAERRLDAHSAGSVVFLFRLEISLARQLVEDLAGDLGIKVVLEGEIGSF